MFVLTEPIDAAVGPRPGPRPALAEGPRLDRVAERRAGAVGLDVLDVPGRDARRAIGVAEDRLLRLAVRRGQAVGAAVLVDGAAADHGADRVAVGQGARERLEHDDAGALAADVAVGAGVERLAAAVGGEEPRLGEVRRDLAARA